MANFVFGLLCLCLLMSVVASFPISEDDVEVYTGMDETTADMEMTTMDMGGGHHSSHATSFHVSVHNTILFAGWHTMNWWQLLLSCLGIAVFTVGYEALKFLREKLMMSSTQKTNKVTITKDEKFGSNAMMVETNKPEYEELSMFSFRHIMQSLLHFLQMFIGYSLMMVFMTFNVYLCIFLCIGGAVGYFLFGPRKIFKGISECCD